MEINTNQGNPYDLKPVVLTAASLHALSRSVSFLAACLINLSRNLACQSLNLTSAYQNTSKTTPHGCSHEIQNGAVRFSGRTMEMPTRKCRKC